MYVSKLHAIYACCGVVVVSGAAAFCVRGTNVWLPLTIIQVSFLAIQFVIGHFHSKELNKSIQESIIKFDEAIAEDD